MLRYIYAENPVNWPASPSHSIDVYRAMGYDASYERMVSEVVYAKNQSNAVKGSIQKTMTPYFEGTKSYEECIKALKNEWELYLHE